MFKFNAQWIVKRLLGLVLGVGNVAAVVGAIQLAKSTVFDVAMAGVVTWLQSPLKLNLLGFIKAIFALFLMFGSALIWALDALLQLISGGILPSLHPHFFYSAFSRLLSILTPPAWASIATVTPGALIPKAESLVLLLQNSDVVAAIILVVVGTAVTTALSTFILTLDLPKAIQRWIYQRRLRAAERRVKDLRVLLKSIDFTTVEDGDLKYTLMSLSLFLDRNNYFDAAIALREELPIESIPNMFAN